MLITRPAADGEETARLVRARGFEPMIAPVMRVRTRGVAALAGLDAVLVTSRNALPGLPAELHGTALLAVGSATAERARAAGFSDVRDAAGDAEALLALARRTLPTGARLLFAHGSGQGDGLAAGLQAAGFAVVRRRAYAAGPVRRMPATALAALAGDRLHAAMFLSAETARAFTRLLPAHLLGSLAGIDAVAIGHQAADALALLPWRRVRVSLNPTLDGVLALL